jgi:hypothetical protein
VAGCAFAPLCLHRDAKTKLKFSHEGEGFSTLAERGNNPEPIVGYRTNVNSRMTLNIPSKVIILGRTFERDCARLIFFLKGYTNENDISRQQCNHPGSA